MGQYQEDMLMNNSAFEKTVEIVRKYRDIRLVTADKRGSYLVSEPNITQQSGFRKSYSLKKKKPIYLGLSILQLCKIIMRKFWYDYIKPKYQDKPNLCYTDSYSIIVNIRTYVVNKDIVIVTIKTEDVYKVILNVVKKRFATSNYEIKRPLPIGKNRKMIGLMKGELGVKIMTKFVKLRLNLFLFNR